MSLWGSKEEFTMRITKAVLSVFNKRGLIEFAAGLSRLGIQLIASGKTAKMVSESGTSVTDVATYTGAPEILGGRVKTLHPAIHAGLLADMTNPDHMREMENRCLWPIGLLVANLYPFQ